MNFKNLGNMEKFLKDEPYFENMNDFCLGNNLNQAGKIFREFQNVGKGEKYGMGVVASRTSEISEGA